MAHWNQNRTSNGQVNKSVGPTRPHGDVSEHVQHANNARHLSWVCALTAIFVFAVSLPGALQAPVQAQQLRGPEHLIPHTFGLLHPFN